MSKQLDIAKIAQGVIENDLQAVNAIRSLFEQPVFHDAARAIADCKGKILVTGSGTSGAVAHRSAHLFSVCGTPAFHLPPSDGLHGGMGALTADDLILAFSKGGSSQELNDFCRLGKKLCKSLIVVTANPQSEFAQLADYVLTIPLAKNCDLGGVVATGCTLSFSALTDVLVEITRQMRGYEWESFFYTHPAGAVGKHAQDSLKQLHNSAQG
ncbi:SIS domain-containing protein [Klebsiella sp. BIGb0407]|uniref:SIS domain-containing protein n=1 Tax=Klebsiella sp. BIGb0407 TaxID=2940603 RepID=UPI002168BE4F|nr:SIS domain-containing protein [Klebsiella sp. BIGb0407]MCS3433819.1 arabinose-5-phosphate isomerase [Klebsiella sp. BIGb0407]